jgi:hypothetical protein
MPAFATSNDDQFGIHYDSSLVPSNTVGILAQFSGSTTGVTLTSGHTGWCTGNGAGEGTVGFVGGVETNNGWNLEGGATLGRDPSGNYQWFIGYGYYNGTGTWTCPSDDNLGTISASTYSTLTGTIKIYYTGSAFKIDIVVSTTSTTYSHTWSSSAGSSVSNSHDDWNLVETNKGQTGVTLTSSYVWEITYPQFLVSGTWQNWNIQGSNWKELGVYATYSPYGGSNSNNFAVSFMSTPGVYVKTGTSVSDGTENTWCITGSCPIVPIHK